METFYVSPRQITPPTLSISGDEFSHLTHVMRMREGDTLRVVDGAGNAYDAVIAEVTSGSARCSIRAHQVRLHEPSRALTLGVGILKNPSRFDFLVEKAVELGIARIVPLQTERTIPHQAKVERWQKLCLAAMKQSGRCVLPHVEALTAFDDFLSAPDAGSFKLIAHEQSSHPIIETLADTWKSGALCIGPEGGFSEGEIERALRADFQPVSLGPRRLRSETAAIASVALLLQADP